MYFQISDVSLLSVVPSGIGLYVYQGIRWPGFDPRPGPVDSLFTQLFIFPSRTGRLMRTWVNLGKSFCGVMGVTLGQCFVLASSFTQ